ncbi:MAG: CHRD domain-containing protein [Bacteroidia bacterium]
MMKKITLQLLICIFGVSISAAAYAGNFTANLLFSAQLNGAQETPPVATSAVGVAGFILNATHDTLCIKATVTGLSGAITGAHIHEGAMGVAGPVIIALTANITGNDITATLTGANLTPPMVAKFIAGDYYINVHTTANPGGEVRGQILLETDYELTASLDGAQETPPVPTTAYGLAVFNMYKDYAAVIINAKFVGLSGPITGAHLHTGAPGLAGPVVEPLTTAVNGNSITIEVDPTAYLSDLLSGNMYINVHTTANPGGEIRGQILMDNKLAFDLNLDGLQETPPTVSTATGIGSVKINPTMDTLWYDIVYDGLSAPITGAHFHTGAIGVSGPVTINLSSGINGNRVSGTITGASLTPGFINDCLTGNIYANVHNANFPAGEIRSQMGRYAREGLTYTIDATQETPPNTSTATGTGLASIDRFKENVHFMLAVNGLTGNINAAHFHNATAGIAGGVIYGISSFFSMTGTSDAANGYWTDDDTPAFDSTDADMFMGNAVYVNMHTAAFPGGEVRGQLNLGGDCFVTPSAVIENIRDANITVYPNPASSDLYIKVNTQLINNASVKIFNIIGSEVSETTLNGNSIDNSINISSLNKGMYFVEINWKDGNYVQRFVKE